MPSEPLAKLIEAYDSVIECVAKDIDCYSVIKERHKRIARSLADGRKGEFATPPAQPDVRGLDIQIVIFNAFLDSLPDIKSLKPLIRNLKVMRRSFEE